MIIHIWLLRKYSNFHTLPKVHHISQIWTGGLILCGYQSISPMLALALKASANKIKILVSLIWTPHHLTYFRWTFAMEFFRPQKKIRSRKFIRSMSNDGVLKSTIREFWFYLPTPFYPLTLIIVFITLYDECVIKPCQFFSVRKNKAGMVNITSRNEM